jgi:predicted RNA-binding protein YlqC (UPF0109 family)
MTIDEKILIDILTNLTTQPDQVKVDRQIDELGVMLAVSVAPIDMGIVIGRSGSMASALKTIMKAVGKANNMTIRIIFNEPENSMKGKKFNKATGEFVDIETESLDKDFPTPTVKSAIVLPVIESTIIDTDLEDLIIN